MPRQFRHDSRASRHFITPTGLSPRARCGGYTSARMAAWCEIRNNSRCMCLAPRSAGKGARLSRPGGYVTSDTMRPDSLSRFSSPSPLPTGGRNLLYRMARTVGVPSTTDHVLSLVSSQLGPVSLMPPMRTGRCSACTRTLYSGITHQCRPTLAAKRQLRQRRKAKLREA